jgi:DNA-binding SARP family transcriptional activator
MGTQREESRAIRIYALGRFEIVLDGAPLRFAAKTPRKPFALLKGLLCAGGRGVSQSTLQDALWPQADAWSARQALNTTVHRLRRLLRRKDSVLVTDGSIALNAELCWVDAWAFEQIVAHSCEPANLLEALRLYGGMFLGDADHPLAFGMRDRLRRKYVQSVLKVGQGHEQADNTSAAIELYQGALDIDCTSEDLHRSLMRCLVREAKPAAVAAAYQRCRMILVRHFATGPSAATEQVYRAACSVSQAG